MAGMRTRSDQGSSLLEYAALFALVAAVAGSVLVAVPGIGSTISEHIGAAVCSALGGEDCEAPAGEQEEPVAEDGGESETWADGQEPGAEEAPEIRYYRPPGSEDEDCPPNEYGGCGPPTGSQHLEEQNRQAEEAEEPAEEECAATGSWADDPVCGDFYEVDINAAGGNAYLYEEISEILTGPLYDICERLTAGEEEQHGECILALLSQFEIDEEYQAYWDDATSSGEAEDALEAIEGVQEDGGCVTVTYSPGVETGPFGGLFPDFGLEPSSVLEPNWTTRDSDNQHCQEGEPPAGVPDAAALDGLLGDIEDVEALEGALQLLEESDALPEGFDAEELVEDLEGIVEDAEEAAEEEDCTPRLWPPRTCMEIIA